jgi:hypothetical protein
MIFNFRLSLFYYAVQDQQMEVVFGQALAPEVLHRMDD